MKREYLTTEQFEQKIRNEFDNISDTDFKSLIHLSLSLSVDTNEFIYSIAQTCIKTNNLSFKQYKALSAFVNTEKKKLSTWRSSPCSAPSTPTSCIRRTCSRCCSRSVSWGRRTGKRSLTSGRTRAWLTAS